MTETILTQSRWSTYVSGAKQLTHADTSVAMALLFVLVAVVLGTLSPTIIPLSFLEEEGPVENVTIVFYLVAVATVLLVRTPALGRGDKAALCLLLLAFAAREADLHKAMFGISILKARFYSRDGSARQIAGALLVLIPVLASLIWLAVCKLRPWWDGVMSRQSSAVTVLTFFVMLVVAKVLDRTPDTLADLGVASNLPATITRVLLSCEELLELMLPLLVVLAVVQSALEHLAAPGTRDLAQQAAARQWTVRVEVHPVEYGRYEPRVWLKTALGDEPESCRLPLQVDFATHEEATAHALEWVAAWQRIEAERRKV